MIEDKITYGESKYQGIDRRTKGDKSNWMRVMNTCRQHRTLSPRRSPDIVYYVIIRYLGRSGVIMLRKLTKIPLFNFLSVLVNTVVFAQVSFEFISTGRPSLPHFVFAPCIRLLFDDELSFVDNALLTVRLRNFEFKT